MRVVNATEKALIVTKGINWFPSNEDKCRGNIDIWWVVRILCNYGNQVVLGRTVEHLNTFSFQTVLSY